MLTTADHYCPKQGLLTILKLVVIVVDFADCTLFGWSVLCNIVIADIYFI